MLTTVRLNTEYEGLVYYVPEQGNKHGGFPAFTELIGMIRSRYRDEKRRRIAVVVMDSGGVFRDLNYDPIKDTTQGVEQLIATG